MRSQGTNTTQELERISADDASSISYIFCVMPFLLPVVLTVYGPLLPTLGRYLVPSPDSLVYI